MGIPAVWSAPLFPSRCPAKTPKCRTAASLSANPWTARPAQLTENTATGCRRRHRMRAAGAKGIPWPRNTWQRTQILRQNYQRPEGLGWEVPEGTPEVLGCLLPTKKPASALGQHRQVFARMPARYRQICDNSFFLLSRSSARQLRRPPRSTILAPTFPA